METAFVNKPASTTHRSYSLMDQSSASSNANVKTNKKEYERFVTDMELEFGPGIVDRLKSKFANSNTTFASSSGIAAHAITLPHTPAISQVPLVCDTAGINSSATTATTKDAKEAMPVAAVASKIPEISPEWPVKVNSVRKVDAILQQKTFMNDNLVIVMESDAAGSAELPSNTLSPAVKVTPTSSTAADLVNKSECIEGLVSEKRAIFDVKELIPTVRRKRLLQSNSPVSPMSSLDDSAVVVQPPPVPPPRPKKSSRSMTPTSSKPRSQSVERKPVTVSQPDGLRHVSVVNGIKDPLKLPANGLNSTRVLQVSNTRRLPSIPLPPRPPKPSRFSVDVSVLQGSRLGSEEKINSLPEHVPTHITGGSRLGVEDDRASVTAASAYSSGAAPRVSMGEASKAGGDIAPEVGKSDQPTQTSIAPSSSRVAEEVPSSPKCPVASSSVSSIPSPPESEISVVKAVQHQPSNPPKVVTSSVKQSTPSLQATSSNLQMSGKVSPVSFPERKISPTRPAISPFRYDTATEIPSVKKGPVVLSPEKSSPPSPLSLRDSSTDSEKENTTPQRVQLKKAPAYGMTTIMDTRSRPMAPTASSALKIDDPAMLTSLKDIGRSRPFPASENDLTGLLEVETLKMIVIGHNSPTGSRSSLKSAGNSRTNLRITFNDHAIKTHEYPSERSLLGFDVEVVTTTSLLSFETDPEESDTDGVFPDVSQPPGREGDLLKRHFPNSFIGSYKSSSVGEFQLGMERPSFISNTKMESNGVTDPDVTSPRTAGHRPVLHSQQPSYKSGSTRISSAWSDGGHFSKTSSDGDDLLF